MNYFFLKPGGISALMMFLFCDISFAQDMLWEKSFGGRQAEYLGDAIPTADYGFILAGSSLSGKSGNKTGENTGDLDYWVWKMDEKGDPEWQKSFGGSGLDFLQGIRLTADGGFILAGTSNSPTGFLKKDACRGNSDFWIIKLDAGGGEQWQKTIGGIGQEKLNSICQTRDGGYILGGSSDSAKSGEKTEDSFGSQDYWIVKLDKDGKIQWQKTLGGIYYDELRCIEQTRDGGFIAGGYSNSPESGNKNFDNIGTGDYWVLKLNKEGETEWEKVIGGDKDDQLYSLHQTYDGGFILGGNSNSNASFSKKKGNGKGTDFWIVKLKPEGDLDWQETFDFGQSDILTSIVENEDHTLLLGGFAKAEQNGGKEKKGISDFIALKISETGDRLWEQTVGSDGDDALRKLIMTRDGGYILAGTSNPLPTQRMIASTDTFNTKNGGTQPAVSLGDGEQNKKLEEAKSKANNQITEAAESFNEAYNETVGGGIEGINKATDTGDSPLQFGVNKPGNPIGKTPGLGENGDDKSGKTADGLMQGLGGAKANGPASGDKKTNFGNNDFWVVKLLDKNKPKKVKATIEASPNPAGEYTNVIVGYDFEQGTATVVDLAGHTLQQFEINSRTVPINLAGYPEGIYIVNIKTNVQSDGVKVMKKAN